MKDDDPDHLASQFCEKHGFDDDTRQTLQKQLQDKINKVNSILSNKETLDNHKDLTMVSNEPENNLPAQFQQTTLMPVSE